MVAPPRVSVVLPLYRNAATAGELVRRLRAAMAERPFEVVVVDDACPEGSGGVVAAAAAELGVACRLLRHAANLGQNAAIVHGLAAATGEAVVSMDADLQDPPEVVPELLAALERGAEVAWGERRGAHQPWHRRLTSAVFKRTLLWLRRSSLPVGVGLFFACSREVRDAVVAEAGPSPYVVGLLAGRRAVTALVPYRRQPRPSGGSGYSSMSRAALGARALAQAGAERLRTAATVPIALSLAWFALLLALVLRHGVDLPFWDEWYLFYELLDSKRAGDLVARLLAPHNEHRVVLNRLVYLAMLPFTRGNLIPHYVLNVLVGLGIWALVARRTRASHAGAGARPSVWLLPGFAILIGSVRRWELWTSAAANSFVQVLLGTASVFVVARRPPTWGRLAAAAALAAGASLCLASGLVVWPVVLVLVASAELPRHRRAAMALAWSVAAAIAWGFVLREGRAGAIGSFTGLPAESTLAFWLAVLGGAVAPSLPLAGIVGAAGIGLGVALAAAACRSGATLPAYRPWLGLMLLSAVTAAAITFGRASLGLQQALTPRYGVHAIMFWLAVAVLASVLLQAAAPDPGRSAPTIRVVACIVLGAAALDLARLPGDLARWRFHADRQRGVQAVLPDVCPAVWGVVAHSLPDVAVVDRAAHGWYGSGTTYFGYTDFEPQATTAELAAPRGMPGDGGVDSVRWVTGSRGGRTMTCLDVTGWVAAATTAGPAEAIALLAGGRRIKRLPLAPELGMTLDGSAGAQTWRWRLQVAAGRSPAAGEQIAVIALVAGDRPALRLGEIEVEDRDPGK
jgi:glycosyltransferase involved in cell wall biosynthesis